MPLNPKFTTTTPAAIGYVWIKQSHGNLAAQQALADELAEHIMNSKFPTTAHIPQAWKSKKVSGRANSPAMQQILEATIKICVGTQATPKHVDHRQGWVAEHLWFFLLKGSYPSGNVEMLFDVSLASTDPGGDGLVIHKDPSGTLIFRLWEIKKVTGSTAPNATISKAADQLDDRGLSYLSRYVINSQNAPYSPHVRTFVDQLMEKWIAKSADSSAGVSVVCSASHLSTPSFSPLATKFPGFSSNGTLEGRTIDLDDFVSFCDMVCVSLWNGI